MTDLHSIQNWLESFYRLEPSPPAEVFYIGKQTVAKVLGSDHPLTFAEEVVLLVKEGAECKLGLYLNEALRGRLDQSQNLSFHQLMTAIEGLSHLLLLINRCREQRDVSQLELELQAEVDKFLFLRLAPAETMRRRATSHLDAAANLAGLDEARKNTYETARRLAGRYCRRLEDSYLGCGSMEPLGQELRAFYRMSHWKKLGALGCP